MASPRDRKRADGTVAYTAVYRHDGKQRTQTFSDRKTRDQWVRLANAENVTYALQFLHHTQTATPTLTDYGKEAVKRRVSLSDYSRSRLAKDIDRDWDLIGHMPIDQVQAKHVQAWIRGLQQRGLSTKSVRNKEGFLSSIFNDAIRDQDCPVKTNPCQAIRLPKDGVKREMMFLTPPEFKRLLTCTPTHYQPFVTCLFSMGLRFGEATALTVADWDPSRRAVAVCKAWKKDPTGWTIGPPKTRRGRRTVAVPEQLTAYMRKRVRSARADDLLFPSFRGGRIRHANFYELIWVPMLDYANGVDRGKTGPMWEGVAVLDPVLGKRPRIHDARHSCASWLLNSGASLMDVQYTLGHESIQTTADRYGHLMPGRVEAVGRAVSKILAG